MKIRNYLLGVAFVGGCAEAPDLTRTGQAVVSDATSGGTAGFYFLSPLVDAPVFSGTFDPTYQQRLTIDLSAVDCDGQSQVGAVVFTFPTVYMYTGSEQYKVNLNVGNLGLTTGECYRILPKLDGAPLGFRDVMVTSASTVPSGYRKWGPGTNQQIPFRLENLDSDGDTILNHVDNCPSIANTDQADSDANGVGDACDVADADGDGVPDGSDNCPSVSNADQADGDLDGLGDACDACPNDADNDADGDGLCGDVDACPNDADNDADGDGLCGDVDTCPNDASNDVDGDGVCGDVDNCPTVANPDQTDTDSNGTGDACELACVTITDGVGAWTGDDTTEDSIGAADAVFFGTPVSSYAPAVINSGFTFTGNNYVEAPFAYSGAFTVSMWARADVAQVKSFGLLGGAEPGAEQFASSFQIEWGPGGSYRFHAGQGALFVNIGTASLTQFQHIAVSYDGSSGISTYLDGAPVATGTWAGSQLAFQVLKVGVNRGENNRYRGTIDDVRVFSRAITAPEVAAIHAAGADGVCP